MLTFLFLMVLGSCTAAFFGKREWAIGILLVNIFLSWVFLSLVATDVLKINW